MGAAISQAMRRFAGWTTGRSYRLIPLTILFGELLWPVAGALLVLQTLRRGAGSAMLAGIIALAGLAALGLAVGADLGGSLALSAPILGAGIVTGMLLQRARSLSLAFQGTILGFLASTVLLGAHGRRRSRSR